MHRIAPAIVAAAQAAQAKWEIPTSVQLAQWGLESGWGVHMPPGSNNPFGIKALASLPAVAAGTQEFIHGHLLDVSAPFAVFPSIAAAFDAHAKLLATAAAYASARRWLPKAEAFANALTGVYATDPAYGAKLVQIMRGDALEQFDIAPAAPAAAPIPAPTPGPIPRRTDMTDTTTTAPATDTKSPLESTTIQGAIISIVGSLAPTLAGMLHVPVQDLVNVVSAAVTIVGFAMTIIGRMKATKSIA